MTKSSRTEKDVLGELEVPVDAYWGINTQRAIKNFQISGKEFPEVFITSLVMVKKAGLLANRDLNLISKDKSDALEQAIDDILVKGKFLDQFPIDVFQTGSGTQTNMNMNEVLANRANEILEYPKGKKFPIHPNDHVNKGQSSNDVIPTTMHVAALRTIRDDLFPAIELLISTLDQKIVDFNDIIKTGRTHLQDAVPIPLSTEFSVYKRQIELSKQQLLQSRERLLEIPLGGTVLGTGINAHEKFGELASTYLGQISGFSFRLNPVKAEGIASHGNFVEVSAALREIALALIKMANDIRWMGSGPRAGLGELILPQNEPGSSIMPGKINPTQSEVLIMVSIQVLGNDATITQAESLGSILDLNVTKPLIIINLLESIQLLANGMTSFVKNTLRRLKPNIKQIENHLSRSLMLVTNLTKVIGYDKAGEIAQIAYKTGKTIREVIIEQGIDIEGDLDDLLDPKRMV
ncbi:MAG: class II fumarate hydratase [Candidatus Hodarchaeales archaeon]|jgi:fumarate hydratase class II